jgi:hypothetical protein
MQLMENVVFFVSGCDEPLPLRAEPEKLPSLLVTEQDDTPDACQKTLVRPPMPTDGGDAQISARSGPRYAGGGGGAGGAGGVVAAEAADGDGVGDFGALFEAVGVTLALSAKPRAVQRLSKYVDGTMKDR